MRRPPIIAGKYVLIRLLGRGAMGAVYEAVEMETGIRSAVKLLRLHGQHSPEILVSRFEREAVAFRSIVSEHVPRILEAGTDPKTGIHFIAMEYLRGEGLDKLAHRMDGLSTDLALRIAAQTCVGLSVAHNAGVIHRDIKPQNIFLAAHDDEVVVKILDFGVAKLKMDQFRLMAEDLTDTGAMLGSPRYMAPEQARGAKHIDPRADIWSLGVVMYEMLAGLVPHAECKTIGALMVAICSTPAKPLRERIRWVPPEYERIVNRALQMDPEARYANAQAMLRELDALLPGGRAITAKMMIPPDAMPTSVLRRDAKHPSLPSIFENTASGHYRTQDSSAEELATQVMVWAKKRVTGQAPAVADDLDGEVDEFPTEVMRYDEFPDEVLKSQPALAQAGAPQAIPDDSMDEYPTHRKLVRSPGMTAPPVILGQPGAAPVAQQPSASSPSRLVLVMDSDPSIHSQQAIDQEAARWTRTASGWRWLSWGLFAVAILLAAWFAWKSI
jgi:serine/threonine protein kinase